MVASNQCHLHYTTLIVLLGDTIHSLSDTHLIICYILWKSNTSSKYSASDFIANVRSHVHVIHSPSILSILFFLKNAANILPKYKTQEGSIWADREVSGKQSVEEMYTAYSLLCCYYFLQNNSS